jgi:hypothetical protein
MGDATDRAAMLAQGRDGLILCIDLMSTDGEEAVVMLKRDCPGVATAMQMTLDEDLPVNGHLGGQLRYMLVLLASTGDEHTVVMMAAEKMLPTAITAMHQRSLLCGETFAVIVVPNDAAILGMFRRWDTVGSA